jgi:hypothetical protein
MTHFSTSKLDDFYIKRIEEIEVTLNISGHRKIREKVIEKWWWKMRFGSYHYFFLTIIGFYLVFTILLLTGILVP